MKYFLFKNYNFFFKFKFFRTLGSAWGSQLFLKDGYFLNNGLSLFSYEADSDTENKFAPGKQPRGLMTPILTYNKKNPCVRRFSISYSHDNMKMIDDFGLSGKILKIIFVKIWLMIFFRISSIDLKNFH